MSTIKVKIIQVYYNIINDSMQGPLLAALETMLIFLLGLGACSAFLQAMASFDLAVCSCLMTIS